MYKDCGAPSEMKRDSPSLAAFIINEQKEMFSTPLASDALGVQQSKKALEKGWKPRLTQQVQMYPTPRASDSTGGYVETERTEDGAFRSLRKTSGEVFGAKLQDAVRYEEARPTGQLNPDWVELLMGVPLKWTELTPFYADAYVARRKAISQAKRKNTPQPLPPEVVDEEPVAFAPTRSWDDKWEEGVPRLAEGVRFRKERIMAMGNGVVPAWGRIAVEVVRLMEASQKNQEENRLI